MSDFDGIRPFHDHEVPTVVARVLGNPELGKAASELVMPGVLQGTVVGDWVTSQLLKFRTRHLQTVEDCQLLLADYFQRLVKETTETLTVSGLDVLDTQSNYLFMSNHRDIVMDSSLMNYLLHLAGHETSRIAVGDNLLKNELAADLMRLNKSFVVERSVVGAKATLAALSRTSQYIRHSLQEGASIWIAQREGRSKDGWDRTDPALLKMLALAHKDAEEPFAQLLKQTPLVPVSVSYELDPCALRKAHELCVTARQGSYDKSDEEDLESIVIGIMGYKGRVHLHFNEPIATDPVEADELAARIDRSIMAGMRVFPTHVAAAKELGDAVTEEADVDELPVVMASFNEQLTSCPPAEREFVLLQYANVLRNRAELNSAAQ